MKPLAIFLAGFMLLACNNQETPSEKTNSVAKNTPIIEDYIERYETSNEVKVTGTLKNGVRDGLWTAWHENGNVESEVTYIDGDRHGMMRTWYIDGELRYKGAYANNEKIGTWIYYDKAGVEIKRIQY